ncbi:hypothetical protein N7527_007196 [Penicillium freii]|nr:hypothetical protein N7527_007196 [Penicillium freii]
MVGFGGTLRAYYQRGEYKERAPRFTATIHFHWEMALLADYVVSVFGLPVPSNRICILWDESAWEAAVTKADPIWEQRSESITTAFVEANKPEDETLAIIDAIKQFMETRKEFHEQRACQDERGRGRGREWLKTIGRRALQSLAPRKSLRAKPHGSDRDHRVI